MSANGHNDLKGKLIVVMLAIVSVCMCILLDGNASGSTINS